MSERAKHAFGALENVDSALASGKIDAFDILFVKDAQGTPYIGWIEKDGNKVIVGENLNADLDTLEAEIAKKVSPEEVDEKLDAAVLSVVDIANAYTDAQIEAKIADVSGVVEVIEF